MIHLPSRQGPVGFGLISEAAPGGDGRHPGGSIDGKPESGEAPGKLGVPSATGQKEGPLFRDDADDPVSGIVCVDGGLRRLVGEECRVFDRHQKRFQAFVGAQRHLESSFLEFKWAAFVMDSHLVDRRRPGELKNQ